MQSDADEKLCSAFVDLACCSTVFLPWTESSRERSLGDDENRFDRADAILAPNEQCRSTVADAE